MSAFWLLDGAVYQATDIRQCASQRSQNLIHHRQDTSQVIWSRVLQGFLLSHFSIKLCAHGLISNTDHRFYVASFLNTHRGHPDSTIKGIYVKANSQDEFVKIIIDVHYYSGSYLLTTSSPYGIKPTTPRNAHE